MESRKALFLFNILSVVSITLAFASRMTNADDYSWVTTIIVYFAAIIFINDISKTAGQTEEVKEDKETKKDSGTK